MNKETTMNTRSYNRKTSIIILAAVLLTAIFSLATSHQVSASNSGLTNDGKGCLWWQTNSVWFGICLQAATSTTGYIWTYEGNLTSPWKQVGVYDASYEYYYNYLGSYAFGLERATGKVICPNGNGWVYSTTGTCGVATPYAIVGGNTIDSPVIVTIGGTSTSSGSTAYVGGGTAPTNLITDSVNNWMVDSWLAPNCASSYNGCR